VFLRFPFVVYNVSFISQFLYDFVVFDLFRSWWFWWGVQGVEEVAAEKVEVLVGEEVEEEVPLLRLEVVVEVEPEEAVDEAVVVVEKVE
jgi:hypothetical protein